MDGDEWPERRLLRQLEAVYWTDTKRKERKELVECENRQEAQLSSGKLFGVSRPVSKY